MLTKKTVEELHAPKLAPKTERATPHSDDEILAMAARIQMRRDRKRKREEELERVSDVLRICNSKELNPLAIDVIDITSNFGDGRYNRMLRLDGDRMVEVMRIYYDLLKAEAVEDGG